MIPTPGCSNRARPVLSFIASVAMAAPLCAFATSWSPPVNVHPQNFADDVFPQFAVHDGAPFLIWRGSDPIEFDSEIFYARWNGSSWVFSGTVNPANQDSELAPRVSSARDGGVWVLWKAQNPAQPDLYLGLTSRWDGSGWTQPDTIWRDGGRYEGIELAAVSQTEAWFVREGGSAQGTTDIFVYHRTERGSDPVFQFVQPDGEDVVPAITIDGDGRPWAVWYRIAFDNPSLSPIQFSRRVDDVWTKPEEIAAPRGPVAPKLTCDLAGVPMLVTLAEDPETSIFATAIWALRWGGESWGTPFRLSRPEAAPDSFVYELSVSSQRGAQPRAVWGFKSGPSGTRGDLFTSRWNGLSWTAPELVGDLRDSAFVTSPAIASVGETAWVAYNKHVEGNPSFSAQNIFAQHTIPTQDFSSHIEFSASTVRKGVLLRWSQKHDHRTRSLRIRRATSTEGSPILSTVIAEFGPNRSRAGSFLDRSLPGPGRYSYWLDLVLDSGETGSVGPRTVQFQPRAGCRFSGVVPGPVAGSVKIMGSTDRYSTEVLVFDVMGRLVTTLGLTSPEGVAGGTFEILWDGRTNAGAKAPSGVYFARFRNDAPRDQNVQRFILMR
jgi:hypothetical protein